MSDAFVTLGGDEKKEKETWEPEAFPNDDVGYAVPGYEYGATLRKLKPGIEVEGSQGSSYAHVKFPSSQSIPHATQTLMTFQTVSSSGITATSNRFTLTEAGTFFLSGMLRYASTASTYFQTIVTKNGSGNTIAIGTLGPQGAGAQFVLANCFDDGVAGDYYEIYAYQPSGGAVNVGGAGCFFGIHKI